VTFGDRTIVRSVRWLGAISIVTAVTGTLWIGLAQPERIASDQILVGSVLGVGFGLISWMVISEQPRNRAVWVAAAAAVAGGLYCSLEALFFLQLSLAGIDPAIPGLRPVDVPSVAAVTLQLSSVVVFGLLPFTLGLLLFPDGHPPSPGWRWVGWMAVVSLGVGGFGFAWSSRPSSTTPYDAVISTSGPFTELGPVVSVASWVILASMILSVAAMVVRFRRSSGSERQQFRWVVWGASVAAVLSIAGVMIDLSRGGAFIPFLSDVPFAILVVSYGFAIARYRLYDVDFVISRTVWYGILALFIGGVYVSVVVGIGGLIGSRSGDLLLPIVATTVVAVAFEPVRERAQRWANHLVYGRRATPYEVLSELTRRLSGTEPAEGVLSRMAQLVASGTGAQRVAVWLEDGGGFITAASWPDGPRADRVASVEALDGTMVPVLREGRPIGALQVVSARGNPVTPSERRLLEDLAGSAGMVLANQKLKSDLEARARELQASRRRLVEIQDKERRRLERDLHDGAQQQIVALKVKVGLAELMAKKRGSVELADRLSVIGAAIQVVVEDVRALARGIYPPLLESDGLASVLRHQAKAAPGEVSVTLGGIGRYPKEIEAAVYFAAVEMVTSAVRTGRPAEVDVTLVDKSESLDLVLAANSPASEIDRDALVRVRDRIEAVGGTVELSSPQDPGVVVSVRVPIEAADVGEALAESLVGVGVGEP
jgi:signal transduction histidine kinase